MCCYWPAFGGEGLAGTSSHCSCVQYSTVDHAWTYALQQAALRPAAMQPAAPQPPAPQPAQGSCRAWQLWVHNRFLLPAELASWPNCRRLQDPVITRIEQRVAEWTHLNISHQEDMQVGLVCKGLFVSVQACACLCGGVGSCRVQRGVCWLGLLLASKSRGVL